MNKKDIKQKLLTTYLLIIYLILLTWIILFKMQFSIKDLDHFCSINLIPFHESVLVNNKIYFSEIYGNILLFVPFGLYISILKNNWSFFKTIAPIAIVSLLYEILQFVFKIGATDITDIIGNVLGGVVGIVIYIVLHRLFKTDFKTNKFLNSIASFGTICIIILLVLLINN